MVKLLAKSASRHIEHSSCTDSKDAPSGDTDGLSGSPIRKYTNNAEFRIGDIKGIHHSGFLFFRETDETENGKKPKLLFIDVQESK